MLMFPALTSALGHRGDAAALLASLAVHEGAHLLAARAAGIRVTELRLMPFGGALTAANPYALPPGRLLAVALAGPLSNLLMLLSGAALTQWGWLSPAAWLCWLRANLVLGGFNLLPALPLDGGRALYAVLSRLWPPRRALALGLWLGRALAAALLAAALWGWYARGIVNLSLIIAAIFLIASAPEERRSLLSTRAEALLSALKPLDGPVPLRWFAVSAECTAERALRALSPDAVTLLAVYGEGGLLGTLEERQLIDAALEDRRRSCAAVLKSARSFTKTA